MMDFLMEYFSDQLEGFLTTFTTSDVYIDKIALTALLAVIAIFLQVLIKRFIKKNIKDLKSQFWWRTLSKRVISTLLLVAILAIWIRSLNALIIILLVIAILIVFIVKGLTNNLIGYFVIKHGKYFKEGHRIEVNDVMGDVLAIKFTHFELLEVRKWLSSDSNTGRVIKFPNKTIFEETIEIVGRDMSYVWHEIQFTFTYESNWQAAEDILRQAGDRYYEDFMKDATERNDDVITNNIELYKPVFGLNSDDNGIVLTLRYIVDYRNGTATKTRLHREVLPKFHAHPEIDYAVIDVRVLEVPK